jgi:hypothetical protein
MRTPRPSTRRYARMIGFGLGLGLGAKKVHRTVNFLQSAREEEGNRKRKTENRKQKTGQLPAFPPFSVSCFRFCPAV